MLRKLSAVGGAALIIGSSAIASEVKSPKLSDEKIFAETIKNVDTGGKMLQFYNTQQLASQVKQILEVLIKIGELNSQNMNPAEKANMEMGIQVFNQLIDASGIDCFKSYAISEKLDKDGMYLTKTFAYTTNNPHGLLFKIVGENTPFKRLNNIPKDCNIAIGAHINTLKIYKALKEESAKSENAQITTLPMMIEQVFNQKTGKYLIDILKSASGEYQFLLQADLVKANKKAPIASEPIVKMTLIIPNEDNVLGNFLAEMLDEALKTDKQIFKNKEGEYSLIKDATVPKWINPKLKIMKDIIIFTTDAKFASKCINNKDASYASKILEDLNVDKQNGGLSYTILDLNKNLINKVKKLIPPPIAQQFNVELGKLNELKLYSLDYRLKNGFKSVMKCNFELNQFQTLAGMNSITNASIAAGMLLPALGAAREKARIIQETKKLQKIQIDQNKMQPKQK